MNQRPPTRLHLKTRWTSAKCHGQFAIETRPRQIIHTRCRKNTAVSVNWCSLNERAETQNRLHAFGRHRPTTASMNTSPRCRRELNHYPRANLTHHQRIDVHAVEKNTSWPNFQIKCVKNRTAPIQCAGPHAVIMR